MRNPRLLLALFVIAAVVCLIQLAIVVFGFTHGDVRVAELVSGFGCGLSATAFFLYRRQLIAERRKALR